MYKKIWSILLAVTLIISLMCNAAPVAAGEQYKSVLVRIEGSQSFSK